MAPIVSTVDTVSIEQISLPGGVLDLLISGIRLVYLDSAFVIYILNSTCCQQKAILYHAPGLL